MQSEKTYAFKLSKFSWTFQSTKTWTFHQPKGGRILSNVWTKQPANALLQVKGTVGAKP